MGEDRSRPMNDDEILDAFADLLREVVPEGREEIDALLVEAGLDPEGVRAEASELIKDLKATTPLDWRNRQEELKEAQGRRAEGLSRLPKDREGLLRRLQELLEDSDLKQAYVHFRNKQNEELSEEELRSLVRDVEFALEEVRREGDE